MTDIDTLMTTDRLCGRYAATFLGSQRKMHTRATEDSVAGRGHLVANVVHERKDPILPDQA